MSRRRVSWSGTAGSRMALDQMALDRQPLEYLAPGADGLVATAYVYGGLWHGLPPDRRVRASGCFTSVGGDGTRWAALDAGRGDVVFGSEGRVERRAASCARDALAVAPAGPDLWVARTDALVRSSPAGEVVESLPIGGVAALAVDARSGRVAAACPMEHRVVVLGAAAPRASFVHEAVNGQRLHFPRGVAFDASGDPWIADTEGRRVVPAGGGAGLDLGARQGFPVGIAFMEGRLWVALPYERTVAPAEELGRSTERVASFYPYALARALGALWVSHPASGAVVASAERDRAVAHPGRDRAVTGLADPIALAPWQGRFLAIAERDRARVLLLAEDGSTASLRLPEGSEPRALAVSPEGELWIATQTPAALHRAVPGGADPIEVVRLPARGLPRALAFASTGALALAVTGVAALLRFDRDRGRITPWVDLAEPPIALAAHGASIVAALDRAGELVAIEEDGSVHRLAGGLVTPRGLSIEGGEIAVAESLAHRLRFGSIALEEDRG